MGFLKSAGGGDQLVERAWFPRGFEPWVGVPSSGRGRSSIRHGVVVPGRRSGPIVGPPPYPRSTMESVIAAAAGLIGALIGGLTTLVVSRQAWNRTLTLEVIDESAQAHEIAWGRVDWLDARRIESRVRFRLAVLGVDTADAEELFAVAEECRLELHRQRDTEGIGPEGELGLPSDLLDRLRSAELRISTSLAQLSSSARR